MIKIDKNVPIPAGRVVHDYPFEQMNIGDSFQISPKVLKGSLACCARAFAARQVSEPKPKFTIRASKTEDTVRIWRVV